MTKSLHIFIFPLEFSVNLILAKYFAKISFVAILIYALFDDVLPVSLLKNDNYTHNCSAVVTI